MSTVPLARRSRSRWWRAPVVAVVLCGACLVLLVHDLGGSASVVEPSTSGRAAPTARSSDGVTAAGDLAERTASPPRFDPPPGVERPGPVGTFDSADPAVANLDPALRTALEAAARGAARVGLPLVVNSGWRSRAHQQQLLDEAVDEHGSLAEALRWVATPDTSAHVSGDAVDVGPSRTASWLADHGARYGLCRVYGNEPWHFELRPGATREGCPTPYRDPTEDPRLQP